MASDQYTLTFVLLGLVLGAFLLLGLMVLAWGSFLLKYEHDPGRIRAVMFLMLSVITATELGFAADGFICPWAAGVSVMVNIWGPLDALLRYPAAHHFASFFSVKQFLLLFAKTFAIAAGVVSYKNNLAKFFMELLLNIWGLPVIYLMALPLDPAEQVIKDDTYDVDIAVRLWQLVAYSQERHHCLTTCKRWWHRRLAAASECSELACFVICTTSPECRRTFKPTGRRV
mmetsp:Transcript_63293/g.184998  ORF Transcript_63293/g.184998 Transcript_63293/m.184998 type:complete len:229 (+) Transcript_63293:122-808(+)